MGDRLLEYRRGGEIWGAAVGKGALPGFGCWLGGEGLRAGGLGDTEGGKGVVGVAFWFPGCPGGGLAGLGGAGAGFFTAGRDTRRTVSHQKWMKQASSSLQLHMERSPVSCSEA